MHYFGVWLRRYAESIISMYTMIWPILICNQYGPTHILPSCPHYVSDDVLFADSYYEINEHETLWYGIWTATNIYIIVVILIRSIYRKLRLLENFRVEIRPVIVIYESYTYIRDSFCARIRTFYYCMMNVEGFVERCFIKNLVREAQIHSEIYINSAFEQKANYKNTISARCLLHVPVAFNRTLCFEYARNTIK